MVIEVHNILKYKTFLIKENASDSITLYFPKSTNETEQKEASRKEIAQIPVPRDEYIGSEVSERKPSGLYRLGQDENGHPKVLYDAPKKPADVEKNQGAEASEESMTANTDQVDRELEKLKEEKKELEQQLRSAPRLFLFLFTFYSGKKTDRKIRISVL